MKFFKVLICSLSALGLSYGICLSEPVEKVQAEENVSAEKKIPSIGFIKNDGTNLRAGDNVNFESLYKFKKGDPVKITGKRYSWFKVIAPKEAYLFINADFIEVDPKVKAKGTVKGSRINLRAGPGTEYSVAGQVSEPDVLNVSGGNDEWYKIEPPKGTEGWIHESQIVFSLTQ